MEKKEIVKLNLIEINKQENMERHELMKDMREDCKCRSFDYCPLEGIIIADSRTLEQYKLVERYRQKIFKKTGINMNLNESFIDWVDKGYAKKFADIYENGSTYKQLEKRIEEI